MDGKARITITSRSGTTFVTDGLVEVTSQVIQEGDKFGASAANLLLQLDDDGTPLLKIDGGTYANYPGRIKMRKQDTATTPITTIEYGEICVNTDGKLLVGNSINGAVEISRTVDLDLQVSQLSQRITTAQNSAVTAQNTANTAITNAAAAQLSANQAQAAAQAAAASAATRMPIAGGEFTGPVTAYRSSPSEGHYIRNTYITPMANIGAVDIQRGDILAVY